MNNDIYNYLQEKRYCKARISKRLYDVYGYYLVKKGGYKANRYNRYNVYDVVDESGNVLIENATLKAIGDFLVSNEEY